MGTELCKEQPKTSMHFYDWRDSANDESFVLPTLDEKVEKVLAEQSIAYMNVEPF